jgi:hypothetical protein
MNIKLEHILIVAAGMGLTVVFQRLEGETLLTWLTVGHDLAAGGLVALAAALKSYLADGSAS